MTTGYEPMSNPSEVLGNIAEVRDWHRRAGRDADADKAQAMIDEILTLWRAQRAKERETARTGN